MPTSLGSRNRCARPFSAAGLYENAPLGLRKKIRADLMRLPPLMQPFGSRLALARRGRHILLVASVSWFAGRAGHR